MQREVVSCLAKLGVPTEHTPRDLRQVLRGLEEEAEVARQAGGNRPSAGGVEGGGTALYKEAFRRVVDVFRREIEEDGEGGGSTGCGRPSTDSSACSATRAMSAAFGADSQTEARASIIAE